MKRNLEKRRRLYYARVTERCQTRCNASHIAGNLCVVRRRRRHATVRSIRTAHAPCPCSVYARRRAVHMLLPADRLDRRRRCLPADHADVIWCPAKSITSLAARAAPRRRSAAAMQMNAVAARRRQRRRADAPARPCQVITEAARLLLLLLMLAALHRLFKSGDGGGGGL